MSETAGALRLVDLSDRAGEPRVLDLRLAERLEMARPRDIRKLIERNKEELERHGEVCATVAQTLPQGGRPSTEYWLNEGQALTIAQLSKSPRASDVRYELTTTFMAFRHGGDAMTLLRRGAVVQTAERPRAGANCRFMSGFGGDHRDATSWQTGHRINPPCAARGRFVF